MGDWVGDNFYNVVLISIVLSSLTLAVSCPFSLTVVDVKNPKVLNYTYGYMFIIFFSFSDIATMKSGWSNLNLLDSKGFATGPILASFKAVKSIGSACVLKIILFYFSNRYKLFNLISGNYKWAMVIFLPRLMMTL